MEKLEAKRLVEDLIRHKKELDEQWIALDGVLSSPADSKLGNAVWRQFDFLVRCVSMLVGDESESVAWFILENACGERKGKHSLPDGKLKPVKNVNDLLTVLGY